MEEYVERIDKVQASILPFFSQFRGNMLIWETLDRCVINGLWSRHTSNRQEEDDSNQHKEEKLKAIICTGAQVWNQVIFKRFRVCYDEKVAHIPVVSQPEQDEDGEDNQVEQGEE